MLRILLLAAVVARAGELTFDRLEWTGIEGTRVRFAVQLRMEGPVPRGVVFERMTVGGVPFQLEGEWPSFAGRMDLRDLAEVDALREALARGRVVVRGEARCQVDAPMLARLLWGTSTLQVAAPVDYPVAVSIPGGALGRTAAFLALETAGRAVALLSREGRAAPQVARAVVPVESRYRVDWRDRAPEWRRRRGMAVLFAAGRAVAPGELTRPWEYDPEVAAAMARGEAKIGTGGVWMEGTGAPLQVLMADSEMERVIVPLRGGGGTRVTLARRYSSRNVAILAISEPYGEPLPPASAAERVWMAAMVMVAGGEIRRVEVRREGAIIVFRTPVPEAALGSPVLTEGGFIGYVQGERGAAAIILKNLAQTPFAAPLSE